MRETTILALPLNGRNLAGIESQVRRPMSTALMGVAAALSELEAESWGGEVEGWGGDELEGERRAGGRFVTRAKKARSAFRGGQGRVPRRPMPREGVVATIRVRGGRGGIWVEVGEVIVEGEG